MLCEEHRAIWRALTCLERAADRLDRGRAVRAGLLGDLADFIRYFGDGLHHRKEERAFFPLVYAAGIPSGGLSEQLALAEHEDAKRFATGLRRDARRLAAGDEASAAEIVANIAAFSSQLRQHIFREDMLFMLARRHLDRQQQLELAGAFSDMDHEWRSRREKYLKLLARVEQELEEPSPALA